MTEPPTWLPRLLLLEDENGDWERYFDGLKAAFAVDFHGVRPAFRGKRMGLKRHPEIAGMSATFWHLISEGKGEEDRRPDLRRCERIRWPMAMMLAADTDRVRTWAEDDPKRGLKVLIALPDFSYLVVVDDRGDYVLPWTAYAIAQEHARRKLRVRFETANRQKAEAAPKDGLVTPSTHGG